MDSLLTTIQSTLKAASVLSHLKGAVYIIPEGPDHDVLPAEARFPAVGITDGAEEFEHRPGASKRIVRTVRISAYVEVTLPEKSIVGDAVVKGVIDLLRDIQGVLEYNTMSLAGYSDARSVAQEASTVIPFENLLAAKKTIIFQYTVPQ